MVRDTFIGSFAIPNCVSSVMKCTKAANVFGVNQTNNRFRLIWNVKDKISIRFPSNHFSAYYVLVALQYAPLYFSGVVWGGEPPNAIKELRLYSHFVHICPRLSLSFSFYAKVAETIYSNDIYIFVVCNAHSLIHSSIVALLEGKLY